MLPDFNRLKIFYHVHSCLSISGAAEMLHITPSAVSQQIKRLEGEIKTPLFTRLHKSLVPTQAGKRLFNLVEPLVSNLIEGMDALEADLTEPSGKLKIGAPVEFGCIYLPHVISIFRTQYPKVTFELELGRPSSILPKVRSGELDFAFADTFPTKDQFYDDHGNFSNKPVIEEEVILACSKRYNEMVMNDDHSFTNLVDKSFVSQQHDARALNNWFRHHFSKTAPRLNIVLTVANHQAVVSAVTHHVGLGIIVPHLVEEEIKTGSITVIRCSAKQAVNRVSLVQLLDKVPTVTEKKFLVAFDEIVRRSKTLRRLNLCAYAYSDELGSRSINPSVA